MQQKYKPEEEEKHDRWFVSYADFITLLFAFFVVMYSVSRVDSKRAMAASESIKWALHFSGSGGVDELPIFQGPSSNRGSIAGISTHATGKELQQINALQKHLERKLKPYLLNNEALPSVIVDQTKGRLTVRLGANIFFDASQAVLRPEAMPLLDLITSELKVLRRPVRVEAHTDDSKISSGHYQNNWHLSAARAATVTTFMEEVHNMPPHLLTAAGLGSFYPMVPNDSDRHREMNRRVEMVVDLYSTEVNAPSNTE